MPLSCSGEAGGGLRLSLSAAGVGPQEPLWLASHFRFFFCIKKMGEGPARACNEPWRLRHYAMLVIFILCRDIRAATGCD